LDFNHQEVQKINFRTAQNLSSPNVELLEIVKCHENNHMKEITFL
jgi:hypothetical protein